MLASDDSAMSKMDKIFFLMFQETASNSQLPPLRLINPLTVLHSHSFYICMYFSMGACHSHLPLAPRGQRPCPVHTGILLPFPFPPYSVQKGSLSPKRPCTNAHQRTDAAGAVSCLSSKDWSTGDKPCSSVWRPSNKRGSLQAESTQGLCS